MKPKTETTENESSLDSVQASGNDEVPDLTRLAAENEQLKTQIRLTKAHRQITGELAKAGARSPELLFDSIKADLQFAEDGELQNSAAMIERLKTSYPEQFGSFHTASIDAGAGVNQSPALTREALAKMKTEEIASLDWADVRRVLANG